MSSVFVGNRRITTIDCINVALNFTEVILDPITIQKVREAFPESELKGKLQTADVTTQKDTEFWPQHFVRSFLFGRICSAIQGKSGLHASVIEFLTALLNSRVTPAISSNSNQFGDYIGLVVVGQGYCYFQNSLLPTNEALSKSNLQLPSQVSQTDLIILQGSTSSYLAGYAGVVVQAALNLLTQSIGISALSCEALGVSIELFEPSHFDILRQHRGQMTIAEYFRLLLEGSKMANTSTSSGKFETVRCLPQLLGPAKEIIDSSLRSIEIELNSTDTNWLENGNVLINASPLHPQQTITHLSNLQNVFGILIETSEERINALNSVNEQNDEEKKNSIEDSEINISALVKLINLTIDSLQKVLSKELEISFNIFNQSEEESQKVEEEDDTEKTTNDKAEVKNFQKNEERPEGMSDEKWAKVLEKRKKKAEKASEKANKKVAKKSEKTQQQVGERYQILSIGMGTTQIQQFIKSLITNGLSIQQVVDYGCINSNSFHLFILNLFEKLSSGGVRRKPKIPKGTRDFLPEQMAVREKAFNIIRNIFKLHGAVEIDTPVFELKETLTGKYGEDSKLIYDLADQGGELLSLRYDLTVPFARFLALNKLGNIKRFHIAKVYRRDNPQLSRGRYREFYQCDFDIAGSYPVMVADAEVISLVIEILSKLPIGSFLVKLNHRKLLDSIFDISGVPLDRFRTICSAVDKLDKEPWEEVKREMVEDKGLSAEVADRIGFFVTRSGSPKKLLNEIFESKLFGDHVNANAALEELRILFDYLDAFGVLDSVCFDLSLARGLDYYTGAIYECVLTDGTSQLGSIAAGGRYDNLVGMFSSSGQPTPCVGVSIGIERIFALMEERAKKEGNLNSSNVQVLIGSIGKELTKERMKIAKILWDANITAEFVPQENPKMKRQLDEALERKIPFMVLFGESEIEQGTLKVKDMFAHTEIEISRDQLINTLIQLGCSSNLSNQNTFPVSNSSAQPIARNFSESSRNPTLAMDEHSTVLKYCLG